MQQQEPKRKERTIKLEPTLPQWKYITSKARFPAFVAGFGSGKTHAAVYRAIIGQIEHPRLNRGFYAPTYDLVRMIVWPRFEEILTVMGLKYRLNKQPMNSIEFGNGKGSIFFRSMDTPERIIGYEHADADVDELDTLKPQDAEHVWRQILARNRQKKQTGVNTIGCTTTPEGFGFVYKTWKQDPKPGYELIHASTYSNPHLPGEYVENLKSMYPKNLLDAYLEGQFVNLKSGTIYKSFDRKMHHKPSDMQSLTQNDELLIGMDFNVTKQAAIVCVRRNHNGQSCILAVDELVNMYDTPEAIQIIKRKYEGFKVTVYPDASGSSRKTVDASISDIALLEKARFTVKAHKANPPVKNRIMSVNSAFDHGKLFIDTHACKTLATHLEQQIYTENGEPDKLSGCDHTNDAFGYIIAYEMPVMKPAISLNVNFGRN